MREGRVVALAAQVIEVPQGAVVKRGVEEMLVVGRRAREAVLRILAEAGSTPGGILAADLCARMREARLDVDVAGIIEELRARRMLVDPADDPPYPEQPADILAWNVGSNPRAVAGALRDVSIHVIGVNTISRRLARNLTDGGAQVRVVDDPAFRNVRLFTADERLAEGAWDLSAPEAFAAWEASRPIGLLTCAIACSDFGGSPALAEWNAFAYRNGWHFLPVVLQNLIGSIGPFVIPGETACYQCMLSREDSNSPAAALVRSVRDVAFQGQSITAYHPTMASVLGDVAALEVTKHYGYGWSSAAIGNVLEVNLMSAAMQPRPILKAPGCSVCSSLNSRSAVRVGLRQAVLESGGHLE